MTVRQICRENSNMMGAPPSLDVRRMGDLVSKVGSPTFGPEYFRLFDEMLSIEHCTVFAFRNGVRPAALVTECTSADDGCARRLADEYVTGAFVHDPNLRREVGPSSPLIYTLRARDVRDPDYRSRFYDEPALSHELVLLGNLDGTLFYSSFYRGSADRAFGRDDLEAVQSLSYFAMRALKRHVELQAATPVRDGPAPDWEARFDSRHDAFHHLRALLLAEPKKLSPREADVCASIVLGYSTPAIGLNLGISPHTVATHRKRAYSKLGISSQNELFWKYFRKKPDRDDMPVAPGLRRPTPPQRAG
jgi:DNA-binding CsgD family transcriptional regulator